MRLTTHNTMSYLTPKQWWARLLPFLAKCQQVDYKKQHELGAQGFDLRLFWDKNNTLEFRHGIFRYPANDIFKVLNYARDNNIIVRILLELRNYNAKYISNVEKVKTLFKDFCKFLEDTYPTLQLYGGYTTGIGEQLYVFQNNPHVYEIGLYSSTTSLFSNNKSWLRLLDDWCPYIYAKLKNKQNIKDYKDKDDNWCLSIDFINIQ